MSITNATIDYEYRYHQERRKADLTVYNWDQVPIGFTGCVTFFVKSPFIHYVMNFDPNRKIESHHNLEGPAIISKYEVRYYVNGVRLSPQEWLPLHNAYKDNEDNLEELINNTIGMVLAAKEYAKRNSISKSK